MINLVEVNTDNAAVYLNFPFCKSACSYCHYTANLKFGYEHIPDEYFEGILYELKKVCVKFSGTHFKSIYFGGGTPSLLSDAQLSQIERMLKGHNVTYTEVSMELHPNYCNFDYMKNSFINRYSVGVQALDSAILSSYRRSVYSIEDVCTLINNLKSKSPQPYINADLIFDEFIDDKSIYKLKELMPDSITIYPNTKGRGIKRLENIIASLQRAKSILSDAYAPLAHSKFIFLRFGVMQSEYARLECESFGDIIGLGHNSVSYVADKSYLTLFKDGEIGIKERQNKGKRRISAFLASLSVGVRYSSVMQYFPQLTQGHYLRKLDNDNDINEKHTRLSGDDMVYLPESEYIRFYESLLCKYESEYRNCFLSAIAYGDTDLSVIYEVYNKLLLLNKTEYAELVELLGVKDELLTKLPVPDVYILVEGIDGSGKDTFARYLTDCLKQRFCYSKTASISVTGQPVSELECGSEAKKFVEELEYTSEAQVRHCLCVNRIAAEQYISSLSGIKLLIRGLVTDKASFNYVFKKEVNLGEGEIIKSWDYYILVKTAPETADERIERRGVARTWREHLEQLRYFADYYAEYDNELFASKRVVENTSFEQLRECARILADEIYVRAFKGYEKRGK